MSLVGFLSAIIIWWIVELGYLGIVLLMALESAFLPVPSEIIMPFAGFAVFQGLMDFWLVVLAGTVGNLVGSLAAYYVGIRGGRPLLEKYGKYILISKRELDWADHLFAKYGSKIIFISRLLPVIRTAISLPAGIAKMDIKKFSFYTFVGSLPFCIALTYIGVVLGENWTSISGWFHYLDILVVVGAIAGVIYYVYRIRRA
jgi:membrane protein DedA with SNARE-associated domain